MCRNVTNSLCIVINPWVSSTTLHSISQLLASSQNRILWECGRQMSRNHVMKMMIRIVGNCRMWHVQCTTFVMFIIFIATIRSVKSADCVILNSDHYFRQAYVHFRILFRFFTWCSICVAYEFMVNCTILVWLFILFARVTLYEAFEHLALFINRILKWQFEHNVCSSVQNSDTV